MKNKNIKMLKIGWIDYINTYPFNFEFTNTVPNFKYKLIKGVPSYINTLLRQEKVDVGCISSAEYLENKDKYVLIPNLSISANGKVFSVAIFSNKSLEKIDTVYLSKASKSSRYLTKVIFQFFLKRNIDYKELEDYNNIEKKSVLLIGDNAIKFSSRFKYTYDLANMWKEYTGCPFVFAVWAVNKNFFEKNQKLIKDFEITLNLSKERFFQNLEGFISKINYKDKNFLYKYFLSLNYDLTQKHFESLNLFEEYIKKLRG